MIQKTMRLNREEIKDMIEKKYNVVFLDYTLGSKCFYGVISDN